MTEEHNDLTAKRREMFSTIRERGEWAPTIELYKGSRLAALVMMVASIEPHLELQMVLALTYSTIPEIDRFVLVQDTRVVTVGADDPLPDMAERRESGNYREALVVTTQVAGEPATVSMYPYVIDDGGRVSWEVDDFASAGSPAGRIGALLDEIEIMRSEIDRLPSFAFDDSWLSDSIRDINDDPRFIARLVVD